MTSLLDFPSYLALQYSQAQARQMGGLSVPSSAIVRRALYVYALHIQQQAGEVEAGTKLTEWRAIQAAAGGQRLAAQHLTLVTEEQAQEAATRRIHDLVDVPQESPFPSFLETLHGPEMVALQATRHVEFEQRQAALLLSLAQTPRGRLAGLSKTLATEAVGADPALIRSASFPQSP